MTLDAPHETPHSRRRPLWAARECGVLLVPNRGSVILLLDPWRRLVIGLR